MAVKQALQAGNVEDAIEKVNDLNPTVRSKFVTKPFFSYSPVESYDCNSEKEDGSM